MPPARVFYSYSHRDEQSRGALEMHLAALRRLGLIEEWSDRRIGPGEEWRKAIARELETADIVLLLVSPDFVNSEYCTDVEMTRALERHKEGSARVIPIIVRDCDWEPTELGALQALPSRGKPIKSTRDKDAAWASVARGIREELERRGARARAPSEALIRPGPAPPPEQRDLRTEGLVHFRFRRSDYGEKVEEVLLGAEETIEWVVFTLADRARARLSETLTTVLTSRPDSIIRIGLLELGSPLRKYVAQHWGRTPDENEQMTLRTLRTLADVQNQLGDRDRLQVVFHRSYFGSALMVDADRSTGRIQVELKLYAEHEDDCFGYEVRPPGDFYLRNLRAWRSVLADTDGPVDLTAYGEAAGS